MKSGREVLERALYLLNYTGGDGQLDSRQYAELFKRGLPLVNQIYSDLWRLERTDPFEEILRMERALQLSERAVNDVMPFGVAMLLAQSESDGDHQQLFAELYNQKRSTLCRQTRRRDVLPITEMGCVS